MSEQNLYQAIRLSRLKKSPDNVRKTPPTQAEQDELKTSIAARGLLQPLVVKPAARKGYFEVTAGGRRLDMLKALHKEGALPKTYAAPCNVRNGSDGEDSLAENLHRAAMHPADEFVAFAHVIDQGADIAGVAERFGVTEKHVRQRLKLGKAAPEILQAYRDKDIALDILMAFTVADDQHAQLAVWEQVKGVGHISPYAVKQRLTEGSIPLTTGLGRFVGREDYEAAGGRVAVDLFTEEDGGYLEDGALVRRLAEEKLDAAAKALEADWKWATPVLEMNRAVVSGYDRVYPTPVDPPEKIVSEHRDITERLDEMLETPDDDWTEELSEQYERLDARRDELDVIIRNSAEYSKEQMASAGCIVTIDFKGDLEVHAGLVEREETPAQDEAETADAVDGPVSNGHDPSETFAVPVHGADAALRKEHGSSLAHADDLKSYRTQIMKAHLAKRYDVAFDALLYVLCASILQSGYFANPLDLRAVSTPTESSLNDMSESTAYADLRDQEESLVKGWLNLDEADAFAAMSDLSKDEKQALLAWCVAQCLEGQLSYERLANPIVEAIAARLDIDFSAHWRPTADNYWSRVKKSYALEIGGEILGAQWARDFGGAKKTELAKVMERAFDPKRSDALGLAEDVRAKAAGWTPLGFAAAPPRTEAEAEADDDGATAASDAASSDDPQDEASETSIPAFLQGEDASAAA